MSLPTKLFNAAMASSRDVHFHWTPGTKGIYIHWYHNDNIDCTLEQSHCVYLDWEDADERLAEMLEKVEALG